MLAEQVIKENAAPSASVGADAGQQLSNVCNNNISNPGAESNENLQELYRKLRRMNDPAFLPTVTMTELYDTVYESKPPVIEGLIQYGPVDKSAIGYSMELRPMALRVLRRLTPGCFRVVRSVTIRFRFNAVAERRQCS